MIDQDRVASGLARVGHYELLDQLSDSYLGPRWRGRGASEGARALRMITTDAPERFASAAAAVRGVEHPSLLPPLELVRPGRGLVVVTEDVPGDTLRALLERAVHEGEAIPEPIALRCVIDLLEALQALEQAEGGSSGGSHLHGGLTLDSVHVGADGRTRLLDPGIAPMAAREACFAHNPVLAAYTAPEHLEGGVRFDACSDVFSLGVVLWEVLACRSLFGGSSYEGVVERVLREQIPRIQRERFLRGEPVSAAVALVVGRALKRDLLRRIQTYAELGEALRGVGRVADHAEVAAFVDGGARSVAMPVVSSLPAPVAPSLRARRSTPAIAPFVQPVIEPAAVEIGVETDPPPSTPSARPERDRLRARLELLVGVLVLVISVAVVHAFWGRDASTASVPQPAPLIRVPVIEPKRDAPSSLQHEPAALVEPAPIAVPTASQAEPPVVPAEPARRPRATRAKRAAPPAKPTEYIPDGI